MVNHGILAKIMGSLCTMLHDYGILSKIMARSWQGYQGTCDRSWEGYHGFEHWVGTKKGPFKKGLRKVALKNQIKRSNHKEFNKIALKLSYQKTEKIKS